MSDATVSSQSDPKPRPKNPVRLERSNGIATILIDNPPVNALSAAVRQGIFMALEAAEADPNTRAIVVAATGRTFPAGADITEFGKPPQEPSLPRLCDRIEASPKPVLAALHGTVLGGGLEVAMGAHYRVAAPGTKLGLPEVKLGILPGAGGTQRAPRLIGIENALALIQSGAPISAEDAQSKGLIDAIDEDPRSACVALAETQMERRATSEDRSKLKNAAADMELLAAARAALPSMPGPQPAMGRIIDCLEAALLMPFEVGLARERDAFKECVVSRDSLGMRHLFLSERRAAKFPELIGLMGKVPEKVAIVGGGLMGAGITVACLNAGLPVILIEEGEAGVTAALDRVGELVQKAVLRGKLSEAQGAQSLTRLTLTARKEEITEADLVIETVTENLDVKKAVLAQIANHAKPGAVIATNSSYQDPEVLAAATGRAQDFVSIHFFAPAHIMPLVEIGVGQASRPEAVALAHRFVKGLRKTPVRSAARPAFIVNRILAHYRLVADALLEDGATASQIDNVMRNFGFGLGPYQVMDRSGLDISWAMRKAQPRVDGKRYVEIGDRMCEAGWLGRKAERGFYVYAPDGSAAPNPDVTDLIAQIRAEKGITPRKFSDREIRDRILLAIVNEGARAVEDGTASCPSDIDIAMIRGLGYPERRGGPMFDADQTTLHEVARRITIFAQEDPSLWQVAPLIERLARERGKFSDLN